MRLISPLRAASLFALLAAVAAAQSPAPNTLTVNAQGQVKVLADTAIVTLVISGIDSYVGAAYAAAQTQSETVRNLLQQQGFPLDEAQLGAYSVQSHFRPGTWTIDSYEVSAVLTLEITDFSRIGPLLNLMGEMPVIRSLTFTLSDSRQAQADAIAEAYRRAREQAESMARAARRPLGELVSGSENSSQPYYSGGFGGPIAAASPGPGAPTEGYGTRLITVTATVSAVYALGPS